MLVQEEYVEAHASLYAAQNPEVAVRYVPVQKKTNDAVSRAGDIGTQILDVWPELCETGVLRRDAAHGKGRPSAGFGLRCRGGAMALQWIQRLRLLTEIGIDETAAHSIVSDPNLAGVSCFAWSGGGFGGGVFPLHGRCGGLVVGLGDGGVVPGVGVCSD